jgi:membrane fusion protein, multidrug efflux system
VRARPLTLATGTAIISALAFGAFVAVFHADWIKPTAKDDDDDAKVVTEVPVHVAKVTRATFHRYVEGYGSVTPEPAHDRKPAASAKLASPVAGILARASCAEGDRVEKGAVLFALDARVASVEVAKAQAARQSADAALGRLQAAVEFADRELERTKLLEQDNLASDKDFREAESHAVAARNELLEARAKTAEAQKGLFAAETQRSLLEIHAPLSATVVRVLVNPGEAVDVSTVLAELIDLDRLVVSATIPASELPSLEVGQVVDLEPVEEHTDELKGTLTFIGFQVDPRTDTVAIRASFPKNAHLRPGQYLRVRVVVEEHADKLAVPAAGVVAGEDGRVVSLVDGEQAVQTPVLVGFKEDGLVEVEGKGIKEGATVVTAGAYGLPKETKIRILGE